MCMCIKNFCWIETGKNVLKIKERRGGCMVHLEMVLECACKSYEGTFMD